MERYLIDSNVIIDYLAGNFIGKSEFFLDSIINSEPIVSVISKIEVLGFKLPEQIENILIDFFEYSLVVDLSQLIVNTTIRIRKDNKIKMPDAIIAATSIANDLILLTRNTSDFKNINSLKMINPWNL